MLFAKNCVLRISLSVLLSAIGLTAAAAPLKVAVTDLADLSRLIEALAGLRNGIGHLRTAVVLERLKESGVTIANKR